MFPYFKFQNMCSHQRCDALQRVTSNHPTYPEGGSQTNFGWLERFRYLAPSSILHPVASRACLRTFFNRDGSDRGNGSVQKCVCAHVVSAYANGSYYMTDAPLLRNTGGEKKAARPSGTHAAASAAVCCNMRLTMLFISDKQMCSMTIKSCAFS